MSRVYWNEISINLALQTFEKFTQNSLCSSKNVHATGFTGLPNSYYFHWEHLKYNIQQSKRVLPKVYPESLLCTHQN